MPEWATITISIIGLISTIFGIFGISAYITEHVKDRAHKDMDHHEHQMQLERDEAHKQLVDTVKEVMKEELDPVKQDLTDIKADLANDKAATITSIRSNMKQLRDHYKAQGYADAGDKATWNELYNNYRNLGGNHFAEYVDGWRREVNSLPDALN